MAAKNSKTKEYSNGEVTIVWKPGLCIHSENCVRGLPQVFDPEKRPWINVEEAATGSLINQVKKCPSGALSFYMNEEVPPTNESEVPRQRVKVMPEGPLMVYGDLVVEDENGNESGRANVTAFCRCGASSKKPYCDGSHRKIGFKG